MAFALRLTPAQPRLPPLLFSRCNGLRYIKVSPGQKIAVLGNNTGTGIVSVTELTD